MSSLCAVLAALACLGWGTPGFDLRLDGAKELRRHHFAYEEGYLLVAPVPREGFSYSHHPLGAPSGRLVKGEATSFVNDLPAEFAPIQVFENLLAKLQGDGYESVFVCRPGDCGREMAVFYDGGFPHGLDYHMGAQRPYLVTAVKRSAGSARWVSLLVAGDNRVTRTFVIAVDEKEMPKSQVVLEDARAIGDQIKNSGKAALYGIHFAVDKADILPESTLVLAEVAAYLSQNQQTRLIVAGHTDSDGGFDYNGPLSSARAQAVRRFLIEKHRVDGSRLRAFGAGMAAPAASNATAEGKARNRRVELVPF